MTRSASPKCEWLRLRDALSAFARNLTGHQGSGHIKPLHWYVACRLVIEGGFLPDDITPRPPFTVTKRGRRLILSWDAATGGRGERAVLGGLKTKNVDVVVTKDGIGPVIAVSMKGTLGAYRNLTNRMEEAVGDCTNLHLAYPALVYGFLHVLRGNVESPAVRVSDTAVLSDGRVVASITRYHDVLARLTGRADVRSDPTKYEAVALALVMPDEPNVGEVFPSFPDSASPLQLGIFFQTLYSQYDLRFYYTAMKLAKTTRRQFWDPDSPVLSDPRVAEFSPRVASEAVIAAIEEEVEAEQPDDVEDADQ